MFKQQKPLNLFKSPKRVKDVSLFRFWITQLQEICSKQEEANELLRQNISLYREINALQEQTIKSDQELIAELKGIIALHAESDGEEVQNG